jgi:polysaccharide pyruvyl transferase WcaK-like protein
LGVHSLIVRGRPLSLLHFVNLRSANVGNGALTIGAEIVLAEDMCRPVVWTREAWDDYSFGLNKFDEEFVDKINATDGMIVCGAVTFNGRSYYANAGMRFDLPAYLWGKIQRPLVFYGLSYRHWPGEFYHHVGKLRDALRRILDMESIILAVRNDGTREWLAQLIDIDCRDLDVIPDPAVFVPAAASGDYPEIDDTRPNVILALNDEDASCRYGGDFVREQMLRAIAAAVEKLIIKWDANIILAPHYFDDCRIMADFIDLCRPQLAHRFMTLSGLAGIRGTGHFYGRYKRANLVISMRVHSMSPCVGLGIPMVPLVTQQRMKDFLTDIGIDDMMVDAFESDLAERLAAAVDINMTDGERVRDRLLTARDLMRERSRAFNRRVATLFERGR